MDTNAPKPHTQEIVGKLIFTLGLLVLLILLPNISYASDQLTDEPINNANGLSAPRPAILSETDAVDAAQSQENLTASMFMVTSVPTAPPVPTAPTVTTVTPSPTATTTATPTATRLPTGSVYRLLLPIVRH